MANTTENTENFSEPQRLVILRLEKLIADKMDPGEELLQYFRFAHLPDHLRAVSMGFADMATSIVQHLPKNGQRAKALEKLLEAKDAAVRARLTPPVDQTSPDPERIRTSERGPDLRRQAWERARDAEVEESVRLAARAAGIKQNKLSHAVAIYAAELATFPGTAWPQDFFPNQRAARPFLFDDSAARADISHSHVSTLCTAACLPDRHVGWEPAPGVG